MNSLSEKVRSFLYRLPIVSQLGIQLIVGLVISFVCLSIFSMIADSVLEKDKLVAFDLAVANALHTMATPTSTEIFKAITLIGLPGVWIVGIIVGVWFILRKHWLHLVTWIAALVGGIAINTGLKLLFARTRPVFVDPFVIEQNFSFPSGHSMMALIGYGLLLYFIWGRLPKSYGRIAALVLTSLLIVAVGLSRVTLGVHYFSDVLAGFAAGGVWLTVCIMTMNAIYRRQRLKSVALSGTPNIESKGGDRHVAAS